MILGGGWRHFKPNTDINPKNPNESGRREDGRNLIKEWIEEKRSRDLPAKFVATKNEFENIFTDKTDYLLGIFEHNHLDYDIERDKGPDGQPSLAEMTNKAIKILRKNPQGFFLLVEGKLIHVD